MRFNHTVTPSEETKRGHDPGETLGPTCIALPPGVLAHPEVPRAIVLPHPLQHLQVPAPGGLRARRRAPRRRDAI